MHAIRPRAVYRPVLSKAQPEGIWHLPSLPKVELYHSRDALRILK
jgi:hypothetical protein